MAECHHRGCASQVISLHFLRNFRFNLMWMKRGCEEHNLILWLNIFFFLLPHLGPCPTLENNLSKIKPSAFLFLSLLCADLIQTYTAKSVFKMLSLPDVISLLWLNDHLQRVSANPSDTPLRPTGHQWHGCRRVALTLGNSMIYWLVPVIKAELIPELSVPAHAAEVS